MHNLKLNGLKPKKDFNSLEAAIRWLYSDQQSKLIFRNRRKHEGITTSGEGWLGERHFRFSYDRCNLAND